MSWRGRGRGGRNSNNNSNSDAFQQFSDSRPAGGNSSIFTRLGPMNSSGGGVVPNRDSFSENFRSGSQRNNGRSFDGDRQHNGRSFDGDRQHNGRSFDGDRQHNGRSFDGDRQRNEGFNQPRGGGSHGGGNSNNQRFQQRDSNRGGRRQYTRKLVDEDIEMGQSEEAPAGAVVVAVTGHPERSEEKLVGFLKRKSKTHWEPIDVHTSSGTTYICVVDDSIASAICRCDNFTFGAATLSITKEGADGSPVARIGSGRVNNNNNSGRRSNQGGRSNVLQEFLNERWDSQNGFLSLDELPPTSHSISIVISRLLMAARDIYGSNLITVSFAKNGLWSLAPLTKLAELFPGLQNLSVQDNEIADFRSLDPLAKLNMPNLTELMLAGNPIQTNNGWDYYSSEIAKRFPTVRILDRCPISESAQLPPQPPAMAMNMPSPNFPLTPAAQPAVNAPQVQGSFYDNDNSRQATTDFLSKFFPLYDSNRSALVDLYDTQAGFSIGVSSMSAQTSWGQAPRLTMGNESIVKRQMALPPTIHNLAQSSNFIMDAWQTQCSQTHPVVLFLTVHGEFTEATGAKGERYSFDRAMLVAPAHPGSRAQLSGWTYVILSDSLMIRDYAGNMGFQQIG